jgi:hypothetical protein
MLSSWKIGARALRERIMNPDKPACAVAAPLPPGYLLRPALRLLLEMGA